MYSHFKVFRTNKESVDWGNVLFREKLQRYLKNERNIILTCDPLNDILFNCINSYKRKTYYNKKDPKRGKEVKQISNVERMCRVKK